MTAQEKLENLFTEVTYSGTVEAIKNGTFGKIKGNDLRKKQAELTTDIALKFAEWKQKEVCTGYQGRYFLFDSGEKGDRWANDKELFEYFILNVYNK